MSRLINKPMEWYPKKFSPGDIEGGGALRLLGKPKIPLVAVLVRETAQNSWDAKLPDQTVKFVMHGHTLAPESMEALRNSVFTEPGAGTGMGELLEKNSIDVLEICDRGTTGLGGPVRNDNTYQAAEITDYVDFVLNIGAKQDKAMGGGTYGYGKTVCYLASAVQTVVIWTRTQVDGQLQSRLIVSAFGEQFDLNGNRYTGRQWWGKTDEGSIEPVIGEDADRLGNCLFSQPFEYDETGTSLLILSPNLTDSLEQLTHQCATSILWNLWPKLIPFSGGEALMDITVMCHGRNIEIPDPTTHSYLCLLYTSPSPRDQRGSRMPSSA